MEKGSVVLSLPLLSPKPNRRAVLLAISTCCEELTLLESMYHA